MRRKFSFLILFTTILFVGAAPLFGQGTPPGGRGPTAAPLANIITNSTTTAVGVNALQNNTTGDGKRVPLRFQGLQAGQPHREICDPFLLLLNLSVLLLHLVQQHRI